MNTRFLAIALLLPAACEGGGGDPNQVTSADGDVVSLRLEPTEVEERVRLGEPLELQFTAYATFESGVEAPIDLVAWRSSNYSVGELDSDGLFTSVDTNGGVTIITASHLGIEAEASVRVIYAEDVIVGEAPEALAAAFEAADAGEDGPALLYPADGVRVPRNLPGLGFMWESEESTNAYRLRLQSEITDISVYLSDDTEWASTSQLWETISASNRDGRVDVFVEAGSWDGASLSGVQRGPSINLAVNRLDARGSVLYWSTAVRGIMRIPFGSDQADLFYGDFNDNRCLGCHIVNENTNRMVLSHDGINGMFSLLDVADADNPVVYVGPNDSNRMTFKAVHPDGEEMIGAREGRLARYDLSDGSLIQQYNLPDNYTQPDFSPDGEYLVMVRMYDGQPNDFFFRQGELVVMPWNDGALGEPTVIVPRDPSFNYYYPAWSPDGSWIAYNRAEGVSYANPQAELYLVRPDGSLIIHLTNANGEGADLQNSYPRWGPLPDDDVLWLAYSSLRDYPISDHDEPQIWVSAIDVELAESGVDPSSAPFWMPGQSPTSDNHLPFWWSR
ncbi:MAG: PD40 domain-containing protein [Alphaproteobacteria bacterium]|nr:PD40 domain-containing protein [Alphaproteobacteria bacterium]MCB9796897.1 PD40 domain-containing protein [Alphaproteobacteria bacterium]